MHVTRPQRARWPEIAALLVCLTGGMTVAQGAESIVLYVATNGNDQWSGALADAKDGDGPFATLGRAQDEVRKLIASGPLAAPVTVFVRGGTYELPATFTLGPEDSGTENCPVVYRAYEGERPLLVGARKITGFKPFKGKIMQASLKGTELEGVVFRQLFFKGERMVMARYPNKDPEDPHFGTWAHVQEIDITGVKDHFTYTKDVEKNWTKVQHAQICIHPAYDWAWNIIPIKSVDREQSRIYLARNVSYDIRIGDRYFVQNLLEELDTPGEWYLDRDTSTLYFWPPAELSEGDVLAPVMPTVVRMEGANHVTVRGFIIEACDGDAVQIQDCEHCVVAQSVVRNCGAWGIRIAGGHKSGAIGNDIYATGAGGISLAGGDRKTLERGGNFATNNYIHHIAEFAKTYNTGINVRGVGNVASHNLIHDTYHAGMTLGGNENIVEYNIVHHTNLGSADTGGIYFCSRDWTQRGNIIRYNIWRHLGGFGKANSWAPVRNGKVWFEYPHFTWGIYLDDPTTGTLVYGNILWSVPICGLHNHGGRDNTFENNIIIDCPAFRAGQLSPNWSNWPPIKEKLKKVQYEGSPYLRMYPELADYPVERPEEMSGLKFLRNIVYYTEEGSKWLREHRGWGDTQEMYSFRMVPEDFENNEWDYNCIYAPESITLSINMDMRPKFSKRLTWEEWQALGVDEHSVLADPMFVDAESHDYRLKPESPALKLGFKPIPVEKIGPYQDELRASWPVVEAPGASRLGEFRTRRFFQLPGHEPLPATEFTPREGLGNFFAKIATGGPVRVVYFGGGIHGSGGWLGEVMKWLRDKCPDAKIEYIHAGICDCVRGSGFSVYRFEHDVLQQQPDLALVDFASADHNTDGMAVARTIEGVVRQAWKADPATDLLFLYAFRSGFETAYDEGLCPGAVTGYERIANRYGIPSINMGHRIARMVREGKMVVNASEEEEKGLEGKVAFSRDGTRPTAAANGVYADVITGALAQLAQMRIAEPSHATVLEKKPFAKGNLEDARLVPITEDMLTGEWEKISPKLPGRDFSRHFDEVWFAKTPGAKLTFKFTGTHASIFNLMGPDTGRVKVTVDGKDAGIKQQVDRWAYYQRLAGLSLAAGLEDGEHTVTVELLPEPPDRSVPINEAKTLNKYKPEDFEGVALRFGWIRLVGELSE